MSSDFRGEESYPKTISSDNRGLEVDEETNEISILANLVQKMDLGKYNSIIKKFIFRNFI